jgi:hypothetical protein
VPNIVYVKEIGQEVEFPDSMTPEQIQQAIERDVVPQYRAYSGEQPQTQAKPPLFQLPDAVRAGWHGLVSDYATFMGGLAGAGIVPGVGAPPPAEAQKKWAELAAAEQAAEQASMQPIDKVQGVGDAARYVQQLVGQTAPGMAVDVGAGILGALGGPIGSVLAPVATMAPRLIGENLQRQQEVAAAEGREHQPEFWKAAGAGIMEAIPQALMGATGKAIRTARLGKEAATKEAVAELRKQAGTKALTEAGKSTVKTGIEEGVVETFGEGLRRLQAGQPVSPFGEAGSAYFDAMRDAGIVGALIGGGAGGVTPAMARGQVARIDNAVRGAREAAKPYLEAPSEGLYADYDAGFQPPAPAVGAPTAAPMYSFETEWGGDPAMQAPPPLPPRVSGFSEWEVPQVPTQATPPPPVAPSIPAQTPPIFTPPKSKAQPKPATPKAEPIPMPTNPPSAIPDPEFVSDSAPTGQNVGPAIDPTPAFRERADQIASRLRSQLNGAGYRDVRLRLVDVVRDPSTGAKRSEAEGFYLNRVVTLALDGVDPKAPIEEQVRQLSGVMNHEVVHATRALGLFSPAEWSTLSRWTKNQGLLTRAEQQYTGEAGYGPEEIAEEAVAIGNREVIEGRLKAPGQAGGLLNRLNSFVTRVGNAFRGAGFQHAGDVYTDLQQGTIGKRDRFAPDATGPVAPRPVANERPQEAPTKLPSIEELAPAPVEDTPMLAKREAPVRDVKRRTMDDLDARIPEKVRVASQDPTKTVDGKRFSELDLDEPGEGFLPLRVHGEKPANRAIQQAWQKAIRDSELNRGAKGAATQAVKSTGAKPPDAKFWDEAMSLPQRARYWYEISGESFTGEKVDLPKELQGKFVDVVAATSAGAEPYANMRRAIGVMSEDLQRRPIATDLRNAEPVTKALSDEDLKSLKFGSFSGTMQYTSGLGGKAPLSTNDVQVASMFGISGDDIAKNPALYEVMSRFFINLRDAQNKLLPSAGRKQPWEAWQVQAPGWVAERARKNPKKASEYDDYAQVLPRIVKELQDAGVPTPNGKITLETLLDPRTPNVVSGTRKKFLETPVATVESATTKTPPGARAASLADKVFGMDPQIPWVRDAKRAYERIQRSAFEAIGHRSKDGPSLISELFSAVAGRKLDVSRIDTEGYGTFEGAVSPNVRIPLTGRDSRQGWASFAPEQQRGILALIGKAWDQAAMAASSFVDAAGVDSADTFTIFVHSTKAEVPLESVRAISTELGYPVNVAQYPNGFTIDINVGGFDTKPTPDQVRQAIDKHFPDQDAVVLPRDYSSEYIEAGDYDDAIQGLYNSRRGEGARNTRAVGRDLADIEKDFASVARERDAEFDKWSDKVDARLRGESPRFSLREVGGRTGTRQKPDDGYARIFHWSGSEGLSSVDPALYGSGKPGAEAKRKANNRQDWVDRWYGLEGEGVPERGFGPGSPRDKHYYTDLEEKNLYNLQVDPDGLFAKADRDLTRYERLIHEAGYDGYYTLSYNMDAKEVRYYAIFPKAKVFNAREESRPRPDAADGPADNAGTPAVSTGDERSPGAGVGGARFSLRKPAGIPANVEAARNRVVGPDDNRSVGERILEDQFDMPVAVQQQGQRGEFLRSKLLNKNAPLFRQSFQVAQQLGTPRDLEADVSAIGAVAMADRVVALGERMLTHGVPVLKGGIVQIGDTYSDGSKAKGLIDILKPLTDSGENLLPYWQLYASARRGRRLDAEGRENLISPADRQAGMDLDQQYPFFRDVFDEYQKWNKHVVDLMESTGVVDSAAAAQWTATSDYIPFYRQVEGAKTPGPRIFGGLAGVQGPRRLTGGKSKLGPLAENMVRNAYAALGASARNLAAQRVIRDSLLLGTATPSAPGIPGSVQVKIGGKFRHFKVDDPMVHHALTLVGQPLPEIAKIFRIPATILRESVTRGPGFMIRNLQRDALSSWVVAGSDAAPVVSTIRGLKDAIAGNQDVEKLRNAGVLGGYKFSGGAEHIATAVERRLNPGRKRNPILVLWDKLEDAAEISDAATRVAIYRDALKRTGNETQAILEALESMNFSRRGSSGAMAWAAAALPFFNARLQGLDLIYRSMSGNEMLTSKYYRNPKANRAAMRRGLTLLGITSAYALAMQGLEAYKNLNEQERDNSWLIPLGDDKPMLKIPIPFEVGVLFKVIPERLANLAMGNDTPREVMDSIRRNLMSTLTFNPIPQTGLPAIEATSNYSFFFDAPIVNRAVEDLMPEYQYTDRTSELAKAVARETNFSAAKVDHIIKGYTGSMGAYALALLDVLHGTVIDKNKPAKRLEEMPIMREFLQRPDSSRRLSQFYELRNEVQELVKTVGALQKAGETEEAFEKITERPEVWAAKDRVNAVDQQLRALRAQRRAITSNKQMGPQEKRKALDQIRQIEINQAKVAPVLREFMDQASR